MAPQTLGKCFFLQCIYVVTLFACVSRPVKCPGNSVESPEMAGDLQVSRKCQQICRFEVIFFICTCNYRKKYLPLPPPTESGSLQGIMDICATTPPPPANLVRYPPPQNLVGFWRSRKIYRAASAGCPPPKQKSWLRR